MCALRVRPRDDGDGGNRTFRHRGLVWWDWMVVMVVQVVGGLEWGFDLGGMRKDGGMEMKKKGRRIRYSLRAG